MTNWTDNRWARHVVSGAAFGLLLLGLFYAGYLNQLLKGAIPDLHRGILVSGFVVGVGAAATFLTKAFVKRRSRRP